MTQYDPFAWGAVRLDSDKQNPDDSLPPDGESLLPTDAEEIKQVPSADSDWSLLDDDLGGLQPGASSSADDESVFGAEILGNSTSCQGQFEGSLSGDASRNDRGQAEDVFMEPLPVPDVRGEQMDQPLPAGAMDHLVERSPLHEISPAADESPATAAQTPLCEAQPTNPGARQRNRREVRPRPLAEGYAESDPKQSLGLAGQPKAARGGLPGKRRSAALAAIVPMAVCAGGGTVVSWFGVMQGNPVMAGIIAAATVVSALFSWLFLRG
jgi:hypothetical protein